MSQPFSPVPPSRGSADIDTLYLIDQVSDSYAGRQIAPATVTPTEDDLRLAARQCRYVIGMVPGKSTHDCDTTAVFFAGQDLKEPTDHDIEAITGYEWRNGAYALSTVTTSYVLDPSFPDSPLAPSSSFYVPLSGPLFNPAWTTQNWEGGKTVKPARSWYGHHPDGAFTSGDRKDNDEFPLFAVEQGGRRAVITPHLKAIDETQNREQGSRFRTFGASCGLQPGSLGSTLQRNNSGGDPLLFVPLPEWDGHTSLTFGICEES